MPVGLDPAVVVGVVLDEKTHGARSGSGAGDRGPEPLPGVRVDRDTGGQLSKLPSVASVVGKLEGLVDEPGDELTDGFAYRDLGGSGAGYEPLPIVGVDGDPDGPLRYPSLVAMCPVAVGLAFLLASLFTVKRGQGPVDHGARPPLFSHQLASGADHLEEVASIPHSGREVVEPQFDTPRVGVV